jgi:hypothetical protein
MLDNPSDVASEIGSVRACMRLGVAVRLKLHRTLSVCRGSLVGGEEGAKERGGEKGGGGGGWAAFGTF